MRDLVFVGPSAPTLPRQRLSTLAIAAAIHVVLFALLIVVKARPERLSPPGSPFAGIGAYVAAAAAPALPEAAVPKKTAPATKAVKEAPPEDQSAAGTTGAAGSQPNAGPVRFGSGGNLTLLKKVSPIYPPVMQSGRMQGLVVLDAIIHSDGTIGDITVLQSTNESFTRAAVEAVKKWRYTPIPYEGIVTVTVNFTLT